MSQYLQKSSKRASGSLDGTALRFVLSAGRTGTVFLAKALAEYAQGVHSVHEPWPGRWELMLGNIRSRSGLGTRLLEALFLASRRRRLQGLQPGSTLIEVNPFLCPLIDIVGKHVRPLYVVHIVREPSSWAQSILAFKASGWRRNVVEHTPFATPYPPIRPRGWREMERFERALWRWRYCNEQIGALEDQADRYVCLRYEDLFSDHAELSADTFRRLVGGLALPAQRHYRVPDMSQRLNASRHSGSLVRCDPQAVERVCGDVLQRWGYGK